MRLVPSDPDIATLVSRIEKKDLNLQPDFQRGEVWSEAKRRKLIDTVLREWHIPPIHVIEVKVTARQEVLDGQQRLAAIRDFVRNELVIDGGTEPASAAIRALHGFRYRDLPEEWRRRVDQFTIRVFRIVDYEPGEPAELFYRLNQPTALTAAEQRNAFFGPARGQIRDLVGYLDAAGVNSDFIGFSNSRMAYDDVLARICHLREQGTLAEKATSSVLAARYRSDTGFSEEVLSDVVNGITLFGQARTAVPARIRLNKATLFTWLWFAVEIHRCAPDTFDGDAFGRLLFNFDLAKAGRDGTQPSSVFAPGVLDALLVIYNDRATSRVGDIASVLGRDVVVWAFLAATVSQPPPEITNTYKYAAVSSGWGELKIEPVSLATVSRMLDGVAHTSRWGRAL